MRWISTRDPRAVTSFLEAARGSVAPGGALWFPERVEPFPDVEALFALPFVERATEILDRLVGDEIPRAALHGIASAAFDFPLPLVPLPLGAPGGGRIFALELFHGPSLAFKDFGARFLARVLATAPAPGGGMRTILTATSGDTGAAVAHAFHGLPGFRAVVLYPRGRVSPLQERQFATLGGNVTALAVDGAFDDCQALVKAAFADPLLCREAGLTSANSINVARLLAQVLYYFEAGARARDASPAPPVYAVPSGNFGNLCAGLVARALGLPARGFVVATNANSTVPDYLDSGRYRPRASVATLSNAMDVGAPNNWERIEALFGRDLGALRAALRWGWRDDAATGAALRELARAGYAADPHTAVAFGVLRDALRPGETGIALATAHPAKFDEVLERLGLGVPLPPALAEAAARPLVSRPLPNDPVALAAVLRENT